MQQTVNLFDHLDKDELLPFSALHCGYAALATAGMIFVVALVLTVSNMQTGKSLQQARVDQQQLESQLAEMRANAGDGNSYQQRIEQLERQLQAKKLILSSFAQRGEGKPGFSDHLSGLGRQHIDGLWLSHINLQGGGSEVALKGSMRKASLLPRYLRELGNEPSFSGMHFQLMRIEEITDSRDAMSFEVTVLPGDEAGADEV